VREAEAMVVEGVDIVDVGGLSTRPGAHEEGPEIELARVLPAIRRAPCVRHAWHHAVSTWQARSCMSQTCITSRLQSCAGHLHRHACCQPARLNAGLVRRRIASVEGAIVSVDTYRASVAAAAVHAGAHIVNDISAGRLDPAMFATVRF
jgi:dihydropteroate synthase